MEKPKRPLSSFNLFYRYKRAVVIERVGDDPSKEDVLKILSSIVGLEGNSALESTDQQPPFSDEINALRRSRIREALKDKILPTARKAVRRRHRKAANSMGISFTELGKLMTTYWKGVDSFGKEIFDELSGEGRQIYRDTMEEYTKLNPPPKKSAPNNDKPKKNKAKDAGVEVTGVEVRKKSVSITAHTDAAGKVPTKNRSNTEAAAQYQYTNPSKEANLRSYSRTYDTKEEAKPINPACRMPIPHLATFFQRKTPIAPVSVPTTNYQSYAKAVEQYNPFKDSNPNLPPYGRTFDTKVEVMPVRVYTYPSTDPRFVPPHLLALQRQPPMAPVPTTYHQNYTEAFGQCNYNPVIEANLPPYGRTYDYDTKVEAKPIRAYTYTMPFPHLAALQRQITMVPLPTTYDHSFEEKFNPIKESKQPSDRRTNGRKMEAKPSSRPSSNNMDVLAIAAATMAAKSKRNHPIESKLCLPPKKRFKP
ncbi:hypothetical protein ACHAWT_000491 [Skeletonema menzelii]